MAIIVHGEHVRLRSAGADDLNTFLDIPQEPAVAAWWGPDSANELCELLSEAPASSDTTVFAIEENSVVIGLLNVTEEPSADYRHAAIDVTLATTAQNRGRGTDAVRAAVQWAFEARGHHRVTIDPAADNARAIACYRKVGFRPLGVLRQYERRRDGRWYDGLFMDLIADDWADEAGGS